MISYNKFIELFNLLDDNRDIEIEIYLKDSDDIYMIVKHSNYLTFGKLNSDKIYKYNDLLELSNEKIDGICLKEDWNIIEDILIDLTFSVVDDKDKIMNIYNFDLG